MRWRAWTKVKVKERKERNGKEGKEQQNQSVILTHFGIKSDKTIRNETAVSGVRFAFLKCSFTIFSILFFVFFLSQLFTQLYTKWLIIWRRSYSIITLETSMTQQNLCNICASLERFFVWRENKVHNSSEK